MIVRHSPDGYSYVCGFLLCHLGSFFFIKCENGRIVLCLKFCEWNQFSAKFSGVSIAADFESKWLEEMSSGSTRPDSAPDKP